MSKALVLLSGGQDSATCLYLALAAHDAVEALSINYGQHHKQELIAADILCRFEEVKHHRCQVPELLRHGVDSDLLSGRNLKPAAKSRVNTSLPSSFVPGRNAIFLTIAHAVAQTRHLDAIYHGAAASDFEGYPDCRRPFFDALETALNVGYGTDIRIVTPLIFSSKKDIWRMADREGFLKAILTHTVTCYNGDWGIGCGMCNACLLRKEGFNKAFGE